MGHEYRNEQVQEFLQGNLASLSFSSKRHLSYDKCGTPGFYTESADKIMTSTGRKIRVAKLPSVSINIFKQYCQRRVSKE